MPGYPALPAARRRHYEIDGTIVGYNLVSFGTGIQTILSAGQALQFNGETPSTSNSTVISSGSNVAVFMYLLFPENVDLSFFLARGTDDGGVLGQVTSLASSTDTTNGADGTWNTVGSSGSLVSGNTSGADWWRSTSPASLTSNNTNIKALRFEFTGQGPPPNHQPRFYNVFVWGTKHSGQTPNDILFLEGDDVTEWPNDDDWGDVQAGTGFVTHTYYVQNSAPSLTAHTVTVKSSGSDNPQWTVSLDNISFGASQAIATLAPGASQIVYVKFTIPAGTAGNLRPFAAYIEADVASWS